MSPAGSDPQAPSKTRTGCPSPARHDKLITIQHHKLTVTRRNKLTRGRSDGHSVRKARRISGSPAPAPDAGWGRGNPGKGPVAHPPGAPCCERLSAEGYQGLVHPEPPG